MFMETNRSYDVTTSNGPDINIEIADGRFEMSECFGDILCDFSIETLRSQMDSVENSGGNPMDHMYELYDNHHQTNIGVTLDNQRNCLMINTPCRDYQRSRMNTTIYFDTGRGDVWRY